MATVHPLPPTAFPYAHNDRVPPPADSQSSAAIVEYYRSVESTLLGHLRHRVVIGFGLDDVTAGRANASAHQRVQLHIADIDDLDEAVRSGIVGFLLPGLTGPQMVGLRVRPGAGSGIDTVATTALSLAESMARDGIAATALTDGADGLYLIGFGVGPVGPDVAAEQYATALAGTAPEIATLNPVDFDGRALIIPLPDRQSAAPESGAPAPYSLVFLAGRLGVVAPLTLDEVAAASAGMPLEIDPSDVGDRIADYGDLAAALAEATAGSA